MARLNEVLVAGYLIWAEPGPRLRHTIVTSLIFLRGLIDYTDPPSQ